MAIITGIINRKDYEYLHDKYEDDLVMDEVKVENVEEYGFAIAGDQLIARIGFNASVVDIMNKYGYVLHNNVDHTLRLSQ